MRRRGVGRVGRPSLVGTAARTAVVAGTATAVAGNVSRRQADRAQTLADAAAYEQQQAATEQAAAQQPAPAGDTSAQLKELADLKAQGVLTEEEFAAQKSMILGG